VKDVKELALEIAGIFEREEIWMRQDIPQKGRLELTLDAVKAIRTIPPFDLKPSSGNQLTEFVKPRTSSS